MPGTLRREPRIAAIEQYLHDDAIANGGTSPKTTPMHRRNWKRCKERLDQVAADFDRLANKPGLVTSLIEDVDSALEVPDGETLGWLQELMRLRNRAIHQDTLTRHWQGAAGSSEPSEPSEATITVGGNDFSDGRPGHRGRPEDSVTYLEQVALQVRDLTDRVLDVVDWLCPRRIPVERPRDHVTATVSASGP